MEHTVPKTILIADDEVRMRRVIVDYLHIKGYETLEAADGVEALEVFERSKPDLILLDVMMPRMDGWEVCRQIRARSTVPILMLTARGRRRTSCRAFPLAQTNISPSPSA